jgi:methylthioribose-1-phosphate isomerase
MTKSDHPDQPIDPRITERDDVETLSWVGGIDGQLVLIDQTLLPTKIAKIACTSREDVWEAIRSLRVRGAPAIGIAAAYGVCLGTRSTPTTTPSQTMERVSDTTTYLATSRPTAVNLFWALDRMRGFAERLLPTANSSRQLREELLREAQRLHDEDRQTCHAIGQHGAVLLSDGQGVLTHCNAGGLATSEYGTALAVLFSAQDEGKRLAVYVDETRPLLQGARLTTWELQRRGINTTLICDSMAAQVMKENRVQAVITGADRIAANGDTANKIGTYSLAVLAKQHGLPFYVAAPFSTFDMQLRSGDQIPIEQRPPEEITQGFGCVTAPAGIQVYNPAFDVTPAELISAIITERGLIRPVDREHIAGAAGLSPFAPRSGDLSRSER